MFPPTFQGIHVDLTKKRQIDANRNTVYDVSALNLNPKQELPMSM
jgi:hypothetical protein